MPVHRANEHTNGVNLSSNLSHGASSSSGSGSKTRSKEWEMKRLRGEVSCAECRRLKLKCDKKIPCSTCTRRGCQTICPLGALLGGQGGRLVLADTDELHHTIAEMSTRIRQLEDALQIEHGMRSSESHPLLKDDLLQVKKGVKRDKPETTDDVDSDFDEGEELLSAMGVLTICEGDGVRYLGATGSEQALLAVWDMEVGVMGTMPLDAMDPDLDVPEQLIHASQLWPFKTTDGTAVEMHILLEAQLPSRERASGLSEAFLMNTSWFSRPVTREQIMEELIPTAYKRLPNDEPESTRMDLHDLALLFMVFAAGAAADLTLPPYNLEAEKYRHLARAALGMKSIFDGSSMSAVQAICLLGSYDVASGRKHSMESAWKMLCLAFSLGQSIGLHRDPARWHLDPKIVQRRRVLFWEMYWADNWKSLSTGRPPSFAPETIDCEFPDDKDKIVLEDGTVVPSLAETKYRFAKEVLASIAVRLCAARAPKYTEILEMDRLVREFGMRPINDSAELTQKLDEHDLFVRQSSLAFFHDRVLLYIHRNYFARALSDHPSNPLQSPFSPSFLATYRSATSLLRILKRNFSAFPHIFLRHWPTWAHALTASIVMGSIVTRSPNFSLAPNAFSELEQVVALFEAGSGHPIVRKGLPILLQMYDRAKAVLENAKSGHAPSDSITAKGPAGDVLVQENGRDLLKVLMGSTRTMQDNNALGAPSGSSSNSSPGSASQDSQPATQNSVAGNATSTSSNAYESFANQSTSGSVFYGASPYGVTDPLSALTGAVGVMPESSTAMPSRLGENGLLIHEGMPPAQSLSPLWNTLLSAGGNGDPTNEASDQPSSSNDTQQGGQQNPMNTASTLNGRPEMPYFPFGRIDFFNVDHLQLVSELQGTTSSPSTSGASGSLTSQQMALESDMSSFSPMDYGQFSNLSQSSAPLPEVGTSLPLVDGDTSSGGQQMDDPWQSFVSASGFQTADELMRSWQVI